LQGKVNDLYLILVGQIIAESQVLAVDMLAAKGKVFPVTLLCDVANATRNVNASLTAYGQRSS
jgi:hypothetical protein